MIEIDEFVLELDMILGLEEMFFPHFHEFLVNKGQVNDRILEIYTKMVDDFFKKRKKALSFKEIKKKKFKMINLSIREYHKKVIGEMLDLYGILSKDITGILLLTASNAIQTIIYRNILSRISSHVFSYLSSPEQTLLQAKMTESFIATQKLARSSTPPNNPHYLELILNFAYFQKTVLHNDAEAINLIAVHLISVQKCQNILTGKEQILSSRIIQLLRDNCANWSL